MKHFTKRLATPCLCVALLSFAAGAFADAVPTLTNITSTGRGTTQKVTLTGTGFASGMTISFDPNVITLKDTPVAENGTSATATFILNKNAFGIVKVTVTVNNVRSKAYEYDLGECLDALSSGTCRLRLKVVGTTATGSSSQTSNGTAANILATLDYQYFSPKPAQVVHDRKLEDAAAKGQAIDGQADPKVTKAKAEPPKQGVMGRAVGHLSFTTGYTQVPTASKVQMTSANGTTPTGTTSSSPTSSGTTTPATTMKATQQQAFVAEGKGTFGLSLSRDGTGLFSELGLGARGSLQDLLSPNQVIQSGGLTYLNLSANNPNNIVGFYEATAHFNWGQYNHDTAAVASGGTYGNVSNLLVIEGGYQNNSGLQQLIAGSPQTNTRDRIVGRFYLTPELPNTKHTTITLGMEYSRGINGGPKIVQIFVGTNVNPGKLFGKSNDSGK